MQEHMHFFQYRNKKPKGFVHLTFQYAQDDGAWIGECVELGTTTEADTLEGARNGLRGAVTLQLEQMEQLGHIAAFLQERHVKVQPVKAPARASSRAWVASEPELTKGA